MHLIMGATGGVGSALARRLSAAGHPVHLTGRDPDRTRMLAKELNAPCSSCDVLDETALAAAVDAAGDALTGLAFCIGSIDLAPVARLSAAAMMDSYRLNVVAPALAVKAAHPALRRGRGSVVLFSSVAASQGFPNHGVIGPAKAGVEGLVRALAADLAPHVRVNAIAPSLMNTAMAAPLTGNDRMAGAIAALHAVPRLGDARDAAAAASYLLSEDSAWTTGQVIAIDGGRSRVRTKG